jgi:hypothetical protein
VKSFYTRVNIRRAVGSPKDVKERVLESLNTEAKAVYSRLTQSL